MFWVVLAVTSVLAAEVTARVEDRLRLGIDLLAVPNHDRDLMVHDELGIHGRPNGRFKKWRLNSYGFRSDEMSLLPPIGCARVMALGASETLGLYESPDKEYPAQLSAALEPAGCYEVVNAAVAGLSLRALTQMWNLWAARFLPDIVVLYPTPAFYLAENAPRDPGPPSRTQMRSEPWWTPRIVGRAEDVIEYPPFIQRRRVARALASRPPPSADWDITGVPADRLRQFEADLDVLTEAIQRDGASLLLLTHATAFGDTPTRHQAEEDALTAWQQSTPRATGPVLLQFERLAAQAVERVAMSRSVAFLDVAQSMNGHREWFAGDLLHFNDAGAGIVAGLIANRLVQDPAITESTAKRIRRPGRAGGAATIGRNARARALQ